MAIALQSYATRNRTRDEARLLRHEEHLIANDGLLTRYCHSCEYESRSFRTILTLHVDDCSTIYPGAEPGHDGFLGLLGSLRLGHSLCDLDLASLDGTCANQKALAGHEEDGTVGQDGRITH